MQCIPIQTRVMNPPQDDIYEVIDEGVTALQEKDIVVITSKVLAIHQGRCILASSAKKSELVDQEAERIYRYHNTAVGRDFQITLKEHTMVSAAGIDESNGDGYYILWPKDTSKLCEEVRSYLMKKFAVRELAVIATDSHSLPLRYGAMGISIGFFGLHPLKNYVGTKDIFGRDFQFERANIVDSIASAAVLVMGEGSERVPMVIVRGIESVQFSDEDTSHELFIPPEEDMYWPLFQVFEK